MGSNLMEAGLPSLMTVGEVPHNVELLLSGEEVQAGVEQMGRELADHYAERGSVHVLTVLNGALHFASDLRRSMQRHNPDLTVTSDQIRVSSYAGMHSSGMVRKRGHMPEDLGGKHLLVVEDILDTGLSLGWLLKHVAAQEPASIEVAVALNKDNPHRPAGLLGETALHSVFQIPNDFVIGYGLDYAEMYRDLDAVYKLTPTIPAQN